jgi:hypothetical protein
MKVQTSISDTEDILGVAHNMKSALMAVNGFIDLLAPEKSGELYEQVRHPTGALETIIENLVFALRAYRNRRDGNIVESMCKTHPVESRVSGQGEVCIRVGRK